MSKHILYYLYSQRITTFIILLYIFIISLTGCNRRDDSGVTSYRLPDGMPFTIWEKEPRRVYGSEIIIIPGVEYSGTGIEPNVSYIKTIYDSYKAVRFYYSLDTASLNYTFLKDTLILETFRLEENDYQIINKPNSPYHIIKYTDSLDKYIYFDSKDNNMDKTLRNDVSYFEKGVTDDSYIWYLIGQKIRINAR